MRVLVGLLCLAMPALAATTTITDTIKDANGQTLSGTVTITPVAAFTATGGWVVAGTPVVVTVTSGAFSVALEPTDTATPAGQYYTARYSFLNPTRTVRKEWSETWLVPTSATAKTVEQVKTAQVSPSNYPLTLSGGGTGQVTWVAGKCVQVSADGTKLESAAEACGTGTGGSATPRTWGDLLSYTWGQLIGQ